MTITAFHLVYGFYVPRKVIMNIFGFTVEKFIEKCNLGEEGFHLNPDLLEEQLEEVVLDWFNMEYMTEHYFTVGEVKYVCREITHDQKNGGDYIVGLDLGTLECNGQSSLSTVDLSQIEPLLNDSEWSVHLKREDLKIRAVSNDCGCCS